MKQLKEQQKVQTKCCGNSENGTVMCSSNPVRLPEKVHAVFIYAKNISDHLLNARL